MSNSIIMSDRGYGLPMFANPQVWKEYVSPEQTITSGANINLTHGLSKRPTLFYYILVCKTAEYNYLVGHEIEITTNGGGASTTSKGISVEVNESSINIRYGNSGFVFDYINKATGSGQNLTNNNWKLIVKAYALKTGDIITSLDTMGVVPLASGSVNAEASLDLDLVIGGVLYPKYKVLLTNVFASTASYLLGRWSTDGGTTFLSASNHGTNAMYSDNAAPTYAASATQTSMNLTYNNIGNTNNATCQSIIDLSINGRSLQTTARTQGMKGATTGFTSVASSFTHGAYLDLSPTTFQIFSGTGNITCNYILQGIQEAA
jgi:hypothetical protein